MMALPDWLIWFLLLAWVALAVIGVIQNRRHARRYGDRLPTGFHEFHPPAVVIMPIKGIDHDLPGCVAGLCSQDYIDYRVIIVVESEDDPAYPILLRELAKHPQRILQVMIAGVAAANEGQKVHNQLFVLRQILPNMADDEILAFADSDAIPGPGWLAQMIGRLALPRVGVATGYRWMVPDPAKPASFWTRIGCVINGSIASTHRPSYLDQAWGGAMAMRASTARKGDLLARLSGALTDDYPISQMCRELGMVVRYVPRCLAATPVDFSLRSLWAFARRQYVITRIYVPLIFLYSLAVLTTWLLGFITAWTQLIAALINRSPMRQWLPPALAITTVFICHQLRSHYRQQTVFNAFGAEMVERNAAVFRIDRWLTPLWMFIHWLIVISALFGNRFTWRGYRYHLRGPNDVRRLDAGTP